MNAINSSPLQVIKRQTFQQLQIMIKEQYQILIRQGYKQILTASKDQLFNTIQTFDSSRQFNAKGRL